MIRTSTITPRGNLTTALRELQEQARRSRPQPGAGVRMFSGPSGFTFAKRNRPRSTSFQESDGARWA